MDDKTFNKTLDIAIAKDVAKYMAASGVTLAQLADLLGLSESALSDRLTGRRGWETRELPKLRRIGVSLKNYEARMDAGMAEEWVLVVMGSYDGAVSMCVSMWCARHGVTFKHLAYLGAKHAQEANLSHLLHERCVASTTPEERKSFRSGMQRLVEQVAVEVEA